MQSRTQVVSLSLFLAALLPACASKGPYVSGDIPGGMRQAARIGCVALHHSDTDLAGEKPVVNRARDNELSICDTVLARTREENPDLELLRGREAWVAALPEVPVEELPKDSDGLAEAAAGVVPAAEGLRYLVALEVRTTSGKGQEGVEPGADGGGQGGIIMLGFEHFHDRTTVAKAIFFDLFEGRELAAMDATWHGKQGWFIGAGCCIAPPFILPFVTPPLPFATATEQITLKAIGEKLGTQFKR